ncbi:MAG: hypothetical protein DRO01_07335 [Thermoproteota archaeon]|nr:MAG: hypothetical protein DRO01_07335 [Candidatus Korarchaeota archaeon]
MTFLNKLKRKIEIDDYKINAEKKDIVEKTKDTKKNLEFAQLDVNVYQTASKFVIIAPIPGVNINDLDISVEDENDVIIIQGNKNSPKEEVEEKEKKKYLHKECNWGEFYRQIILPQEINVEKIEAKQKNGILIIKLPILRLKKKGGKINIKS